MIQKQKKRKYGHGLLIATIAIILLGTLITPMFTVNNAEAINVSNLTISNRRDETVDVTWTVSGLAGTTYKYEIYVTPLSGTGGEELKNSATGITNLQPTITVSGLSKGTSYTMKVVITDEVSQATVTTTTTFSTTGAVGIQTIQAVFWNAYGFILAISVLLCTGLAAYFLVFKRASEEDDRLRAKYLQYAVECIITVVLVAIIPMIIAIAQGWVQI